MSNSCCKPGPDCTPATTCCGRVRPCYFALTGRRSCLLSALVTDVTIYPTHGGITKRDACWNSQSSQLQIPETVCADESTGDKASQYQKVKHDSSGPNPVSTQLRPQQNTEIGHQSGYVRGSDDGAAIGADHTVL